MLQVLMGVTDFFSAVTTMGSNLYANLMKVLIIIGVISFIIGVIILMVTHDDKKVGSAKGIIMRVIFGIVIVCIAGSIVSYLLSWTSGYRFDASQTATILPAVFTLLP